MNTEKQRTQQLEMAFKPRAWYRASLAVLLFIVPALVLLVADTGPYIQLCGRAAVFLLFVFYAAFQTGCRRIVALPEKILFEAASLSQRRKVTELRRSEIFQVREHMLPLWGKVLVVRGRRDQRLCVVWASGWKREKELRALFAGAAQENHGVFVCWQANLKAAPRALFRWLKGRLCLR